MTTPRRALHKEWFKTIDLAFALDEENPYLSQLDETESNPVLQEGAPNDPTKAAPTTADVPPDVK